MKDTQTKDRFLELRAGGMSYQKIALELQVSKQTVIDWGRELQEEVSNLRAVELEALQEKFLLTKEKRLEAFGGILQKIGAELATRNLAEVETPKLFDMFLKSYGALKEEAGIPALLSEEEAQTAKEVRAGQMREAKFTASLKGF